MIERVRTVPSGLWLTAILALATVATRIPFASEMLYSYDSANYAFAIRDYYHVGHHHPHPPGYPLYVGAGWLLTKLLGEPNRGLVAVSILASALAVGATHRLAVAQHGAAVGLGAALLLLFSTGFWGYGEVAYPYTTLAGFAALIGLVTHRLSGGSDRMALGSGVIFGIAAGFRWDLALELSLLWGLGLLGCSWRGRILAASAFGLVVLAWGAPMVALSGGPTEYFAALQAQSGYVVGAFSVAAGGETIARYNADLLVHYLRLSLGGSLLLLVYSLGRTLTPARLAADHRLRFLLVWLLPPLSIFLLLHIGDAGYVLVIAPAICILLAVTLADLTNDFHLVAGIAATRSSKALGQFLRALLPLTPTGLLLVMVAWNVDTFLNDPGPARRWEIGHIDRLLRSQVEHVRSTYSPAETIVLAHDRYRQLQYYLEGYRHILLFDEYGLDYREQVRELPIPDGVTTLIVADDTPALGPVAQARGRTVDLYDAIGGSIRVVDVGDADSLQFGYGLVELRGP
jgi:hypothetical protein